MKKIWILLVMFACSFCFMGLVNADYSKTDWNKISCFNKTDTEYADVSLALARGYTSYDFNATTGVYTSSGSAYASLPETSQAAGTFYVPQNNTLLGYLIGTDAINSIPSIASSAGSAEVCTISRTSEVVATPTVDNPTNPTNPTPTTNNPTDEDDSSNVVNDDASDDASDDVSDVQSSGKSVVTSENPNTGLSDYVIYLLPVLLIGGSALVLKRRLA